MTNAVSVDVARADVGIFGGSGLYSLATDAAEVALDTPYGSPSAPVTIIAVGDRRVAFLPRHGRSHEYAPHRINYRANVWAMRSLGVRALLGPCAAGSLQPEVRPGDFVVLDQLVDRTWGRADTFHDAGGPDEGAILHHVTFADPYDEPLRAALVETARDQGLTVHDRGTMVVIQGPRFSTRAESSWFRAQGWQVVNMTGYPEAVLAAEAGIPYAAVALITDYDAGVADDPGVGPVTQDAVFGTFADHVDRLRDLLFSVVGALALG